MRANSQNIGWEPSIEARNAAIQSCLFGAVDEGIVRESAVSAFSLLLKLGLDIVKGKTHSGCNSSRDNAGKEPDRVWLILAQNMDKLLL